MTPRIRRKRRSKLIDVLYRGPCAAPRASISGAGHEARNAGAARDVSGLTSQARELGPATGARLNRSRSVP